VNATYKTSLKSAALACAGAATAFAAVIVYQVRRAPTRNAYFVALGSSFAAGAGLGKRAPGSPIVSYRSINGYPQQLARLLKVPSFTDMTSSGSTVRHVLHGGQFGLGPQIDALGPDTRLVTLTAGGNDIGYVGDLMAMAYRNRKGLVGSLARVMKRGAKPVQDRGFAALEADLIATLIEIGGRTPQAQIVVATYPTILPANDSCASIGISSDQAAMMRKVAERLAEVTRSAAAKTGATLVDIASLSEGHDACSADPWVNGARPEQGAAFHPTLRGARATAQAIADALEDPADRPDRC
jgi:lysophospholipase L1-like esterase